jgi:hypothetical protein
MNSVALRADLNPNFFIKKMNSPKPSQIALPIALSHFLLRRSVRYRT